MTQLPDGARTQRGAGRPRGHLRVVQPGAGLLVEDLGRPGWAHLGVPRSGALDPEALALANRLVGNPPGAAGLEVLLGGAVLEVDRATRVALTGAAMPLRVAGRPAGWGEPVSVDAGQLLEVGRAVAGLRGWLAVGGGLDVPEELGSRATDTLSGLGPEPLRAGDALPLGDLSPSYVPEARAVPSTYAAGEAVLVLRLGPRHDWFTDEAVARLTSVTFVVSPDSDRIGLRLDCAERDALERRLPDELPSEGIALGAVQVPANGRPLVFLADHPVTGGYPVVGVVDAASLRRCAQLRPGDAVRFRPARSTD